MKIATWIVIAFLLPTLPVAAIEAGLVVTVSPPSSGAQVLRLHNDQLSATSVQALSGTVRYLGAGSEPGRVVAVTQSADGNGVVHFLTVQGQDLVAQSQLALPSGAPKLFFSSPDRRRLLVLTTQPSRLIEIDLAERQLLSQQELPWEPVDGAISRDGELLFLISHTNILQPVHLAGLQWLSPVTIAGGFPEGSLSISVAPTGHIYITGPNAVIRHAGIPPFQEEARTILQSPVFHYPGKLHFTSSGARAFAAARSQGNHSVGLFDPTPTTAAPAGTFVATGFAIHSSAAPGLAEAELLDELLVAGEDLAYGRAARINQPFLFRVSSQGGITTQDIRLGGTPIVNTTAIAVSHEIPSARFLFAAGTDARLIRFHPSSGSPTIAELDAPIAGVAYVAFPSANAPVQLYAYPSATLIEPDKPLRLYVRAVDADGRAVQGANILLSTDATGLNISASRSVTDADGFAWFEIQTAGSAASATLQLSVAGGPATLTLNLGSTSPSAPPADSTSSSTPRLIKVSGDGQLKVTGAVFDFLVVRAVDAQGNPMPGKLVRWTTNNPAIQFVGETTALTDANGEARVIPYRTVPMAATAAFEQFSIFATSDIGSVTFFATDFPADLPGYPNIYQQAPSTLDPTIRLKLGKPTPNVLVISVKSGIGDGRPSQLPIPNVGLTVTSENQNPATGPVVRCAEGTALSDRNGMLTCSLVASGRVGQTFLRADVGNLVYYDRILAIVEPGDPVPPSIVSGNNQSGQTGTTLPNRLVARVVDAGGNPLPGTRVTWSVSNPSALTLFDTIDIADSKGEVSTAVRLGGLAGTFTVSVRVGTLQSTFTVNVQTTAAVLRKVSGDNQTEGQTNTAFPQPLVVEVLNQQNVPVAGVTVQWSIAGPGTLSAASTTTGSNGRTQVNVTAGSTPGTITVTASVAGLPAVSFTLQSRLPGPSVTAASFVNYSTRKAGAVAPGALVLLTAAGIARNVNDLAVATPNIVTGQLPLILKGLVVEFRSGANTYYAPIYWIARDGNAEMALIQVPYEISPPTVNVTVYVDSVGTTVNNLRVDPVSPGILTDQTEGRAAAIVLGFDGRPITRQTPARPGEVVRLFAIGLGPTTPPSQTNRVGLPGQKVASQVIIGFNGEGITPLEAKLTENLIGIYEVHFRIPENAAAGEYTLGLGVIPPNSATVYYAQEEGALIPVGSGS